tara:strand:- start:479 stop:619 length:141 start_codon:yes stop_codon:yes gene_type:complete
MKTLNKPVIFKKNRYFDKRGYFQEIFLEKELKKKLNLLQLHILKKT